MNIKNTLLVVLAMALMLPAALNSGCNSSTAASSAGQVPVGYLFITQPGGATAGAAFTQQPEVAVVDASGNVVLGYNWMVMVLITPGTGSPGAKLAGIRMVYAGNGIATFSDLSIDTPGSGYTITINDGSALSITSAPFDVAASPNAPAEATLKFIGQPDGAIAGSAFTTQPVVAVVDANGNTDTSYAGSVTLSIMSGSGASGAKLSGILTLRLVGGIAFFTGLSIDKPGMFYSLTASSGSLAAASDTFDVAAAAPPGTTVG